MLQTKNFFRWFGRDARRGTASQVVGKPSVPRGHRVYAIGDVHGRLDLLEDLLRTIEDDNAGRSRAETTIVLLGDLIDRGPASAQVVERVSKYRLARGRVICLCGNHEEVLIRVLLGDSELLHEWMKFGGAECLESYGLSATDLKRMKPNEAVRRIRQVIPPTHVRFLHNLADSVRIGDYLFVHAGIRPGIELMSQAQSDLRWIRDPFLSCEEDHGFIVVHGHTIAEKVEAFSNRIGIDTGAYRSGVLTALALEGPTKWLLEAGGTKADLVRIQGVLRTERDRCEGSKAASVGGIT